MDYIRENILVAHIYYEISEFSRFTKNELHATSDLIASVGGLLGLFLGFSVFSIVEIVYHLSMKLICNSIRAKKQLQAEMSVVVAKPKLTN
ncbi:pickpocket protein 28-like [Photinus pyralis]|uniref:pickpocket protein 28-like n=1 Tax=Photinus pyralis TaxID=7054 RepID=UPI00126767C2|nr:pickpocket protein 28-like [Photinus pyralis]